jgi:hypothetical protein
VEEKDKRTFLKPDAFKKNPKTKALEVDSKNSEICVRLEALGRPPVHYAAKANAYWKDPQFTKPFTDAEIQALDLPIPAQIEDARRKAIKVANESGTLIDHDQLLRDTSPSVLHPPKALKERIAGYGDETDRIISRVNRSTLGK